MGLLGKLLGLSGDQEKIKEALSNGAMIIDVRTEKEFAGGHPPNAMNMPLDTIPVNLEKIKAFNKPVVLCCASGMRSAKATSILTKYDIEAYNAGPWTNLK
ncbi:MAG: sulfurtransferase [Bacteroidetes bacterium]|nr:sulfurtransferase [Bacteroidota bacterium]